MQLFDGVFVLKVYLSTLQRRLASRSEDEFGAKIAEHELILRLYETEKDIPNDAVTIDATVPLSSVIDEILRAVASGSPAASR